MENYQLIGILILPVLIIGIMLKPEILLYYLVLDSWIITRISQVSIFYNALSFNRLIVYLGLLFIIGRRLMQRSLMPKAAKTFLSIMTTIFLVFCFFSYFSYTGELELTLFNNVVFFFLALALLETDFRGTFRIICLIIIIPIVLLSVTTLVNNLVHMDLGQKSFAGNRNSTAVYILAGLPFLFVLREEIQSKTMRIFLNTAIFLGCVTVGLSLGRLVTFILIVSLCFFCMKGYLNVRSIGLVFMLIVIIAVIKFDAVLSYADKLVRLPSGTRHSISKYNREELGAVTSGRSESYEMAWKLFKRSPFWGIGYDRWANMNKNHPGSSLHSRWLQILAEGGAVGFFLYALLYVVGFWNLWKGRKRLRGVMVKQGEVDAVFWALVVLLLAGTTDNHGFTDRIFYLFLAMAATIGAQGINLWSSQMDRTVTESTDSFDKGTV
jgi:O-antigen ligase